VYLHHLTAVARCEYVLHQNGSDYNNIFFERDDFMNYWGELTMEFKIVALVLVAALGWFVINYFNTKRRV
jgi:hypothetical protein